MKREKRLTKRERKAADPSDHDHDHKHIHCVACGRHIEPGEFSASPPSAKTIACQHGSKFPCCSACVDVGQRLLDEHDRTGKAVQTAGAWH